MIIGGIIAFCILLLILAFLLPRLSRYPQRGADSVLSVGGREAGRAPGRLGRWLAKPFGTSRRAVDRSAGAGRRGRSKMPF
jgi:Family of unknown function (DUF6411)